MGSADPHDIEPQRHSFESRRKAYLDRYQAARENPFFVSRALEQIIACLGELTTATRWGAVRSALDKALKATSSTQPEELVCYCLGDLSELGVAFQLAFFLLIANQFAIPPARRLIFDPIHTKEDRQLLQLCGCTSLSQNEQALRRVQCRTLFYMPFAPFSLTNNVIRANWDILDRVMIIGNPLNWVVDYGWSSKKEKQSTEGGGSGSKDGGSGSSSGESEVKGVIVENPVAYLLQQQHCGRQQQRRTVGTTNPQVVYASRAPCVEAALSLATEVMLWEGDLVTWTLAQAAEEVKAEKAEMEAQKAEMMGAQQEQEQEHDQEEENGGDDDSGGTMPTEAAQRAQTRYSLNASLAVFAPPPKDWPKQPPPTRQAPEKTRMRSRL
jgi:hypothetical protein